MQSAADDLSQSLSGHHGCRSISTECDRHSTKFIKISWLIMRVNFGITVVTWFFCCVYERPPALTCALLRQVLGYTRPGPPMWPCSFRWLLISRYCCQQKNFSKWTSRLFLDTELTKCKWLVSTSKVLLPCKKNTVASVENFVGIFNIYFYSYRAEADDMI